MHKLWFLVTVVYKKMHHGSLPGTILLIFLLLPSGTVVTYSLIIDAKKHEDVTHALKEGLEWY